MNHLILPAINKKVDQFSLSLEKLSLAEGESLAVIGRNGAGKSTYLNALEEVGGDDYCYLAQVPFIIELLSVYHNIYAAKLDEYSVFANLKNLIFPRADIKAQVLNLLEEVDLSSKINQKAGSLSGGEKQKMSIARGLFTGRPYLLADEPLSSLAKADRKKILKSLLESFSHAVIVLHDLEFLPLFSKVLIIEKGEKLYFGSVDSDEVRAWAK